mmetsp:Transcript_78705/g.131985  ORF Transcript_78705/g.131985 Transcript_78705/m.131985 type:complete len:239 (+) Transcript_78705:1117-1833(+)
MKLDPGTVNFRSLGHIHSSEPQPHQALFCKSEVVLLQGCSARRQSLLTVVVTGNNGDVHSFYLSQASFALQAHALFFATTARNHVLWRIPDNHRCRWQSGFVNGLINWNAVRSVNRNGNGSVHGSVDNVHLLLDFDVWTNNRLNNWWLVLNHHTCWGDDWNTLLGGLWGFIWLRLGTRNWKRLTNRHRLGNWWGNGSSHRGGSGNKGTIALWFQRWWRRRTISMFVLLRCLRVALQWS